MRVVRAVVLDEADQLMKSDFEDQTLSILQLITSSCLQQIIVSATVTQNLRSAILPRLQNPIEVTISDIERLNSSLHYHFIWTEENQKRNRFQALLKSIAKDQSIASPAPSCSDVPVTVRLPPHTYAQTGNRGGQNRPGSLFAVASVSLRHR